MCRMLHRDDVPPVPIEAHIVETDDETVYAFQNKRWRYRRGILVKYVAYSLRKSGKAPPAVEMYRWRG